MTGADHYREAERLLTVGVNQRGSELDTICTAAAQVHATLALAAATALGREGSDGTQPSQDRAAWFDAAAECRKATS